MTSASDDLTDPDETLTRLAGRLAYVQVKDIAALTDLTPRARSVMGRCP